MEMPSAEANCVFIHCSLRDTFCQCFGSLNMPGYYAAGDGEHSMFSLMTDAASTYGDGGTAMLGQKPA